jgi:hypothetical protein
MAHSQNLSRKDPGGTRPLVVKSFALTEGRPHHTRSVGQAGHGSKLTAPRRPMIDCWRKIPITLTETVLSVHRL